MKRKVQLRRAGYYFCAPAVCLALFWRVLFTWFRTDDFAYLGNASSVHDLHSLVHALFQPANEGTVRLLTDRLNYLTFYWLFGVAAAPFHIWGLLIWFGSLALAAKIGARIAGSAAAGLAAALLWTTSAVIVTPLAWAPVYEMLLLSLLALAALYSRIRWLETPGGGWLAAEWVFYILGFGATETIVMYPAVAALYTWALARRDLTKKGERGVFLLFLPAAIFTALHFLIIPKTGGETYRVVVDGRLPGTLWSYLRTAMGPERYGSQWVLLVALAAFALWRRDRAVLFCVGWFVLWLTPLLPLPNHISEYYLTVPLAGLAWMAGLAVVAAWRVGWLARASMAACLALYLVGNLPATKYGTEWYLERSSRMRLAFRGMQEAAFRHPGTMVLFKGVDSNLFQWGFQDNPFPLAGVSQGFLAPGTEKRIVTREDLGDISKLTISEEDALRVIQSGKARVLEIEPAGPPRDITGSYEAVLRAEMLGEGRDFVDVGHPAYYARLGPSWHEIENGYRWMPKSATIQLVGPRSAGERLYVTGFGAPQALASGPVTLRFRVAPYRATRGNDDPAAQVEPRPKGAVFQPSSHELGTVTVTEADRPFQRDFALPEKLIGSYFVEVSIESNKTFRVPGDGRDLGMVFGTFSIR